MRKLEVKPAEYIYGKGVKHRNMHKKYKKSKIMGSTLYFMLLVAGDVVD